MKNKFVKLHLIVLIFGFTAILGKLILVHPLVLVLYRTSIATLILFVILKLKKTNISFSTINILKLLGIGAMLGLHWFCFFGSARLSNVSISLVAVSTTSFFTGLLEPFLSKKKINYLELLFGFLALAGMLIIFKFEFKFINGLLVGLLGAVLAAVFSILNGKMILEFDSSVINFYELLGAALMALILIPFFKTFNLDSSINLLVSLKDFGWLIILAGVCTVYPYIEMLNLYKTFSVFTVNLSLNMEPIYGIILALIIFKQNEIMSAGFYIGGLLIFLSVILQPILNKQKI